MASNPAGDGARRRCPPTTSTRTAPAPGGRNTASGTPTTSTVEGELPADLSGRVPAQHREPGPPVDRPLPPLRRRRDAPPDRLPRRPGQLPEPVRAHRRLPRRAGRGRVALDGDARRARAVQAGRRLGRPRPHEGRVEHRRRRPQRPGPHELLAVRRPLRARSAHPRAAGQGRRGRPGFPSPTGISAHPKLDERTGELLVFGYGKEWPYLHLGRRQRRRRARAVDRRRAARPAAAARHGLHGAVRHPQRPARSSGTRTCSPRACTSRASSPTCPSRFAIVRRDGTGERPLVRGRPHLRPALDQRLRGRRRGGARRLLPARPVTAQARRRPTPHMASVYRYLDLEQLQARPHRWRFNLVTGQTTRGVALRPRSWSSA